MERAILLRFHAIQAARPPRGLLCLLALTLLMSCQASPAGKGSRQRQASAPPRRPQYVRASWVVRTDLATKASIDRVVAEATEGGLNTLIAQVRGRGDAWFQGGREPLPNQLAGSSFDPLAYLIETAHAAGVGVHAWVNLNLVADAGQLPTNPRHLSLSHPEWLMTPVSLVQEAADLDLRDPKVFERVVADAIKRKATLEGLYADPAHPEYVQHLLSVVVDLVARYAIQGLHLDYARYPNPDFGLTARTAEDFRRDADNALGQGDRLEMANRVAKNPLAYIRRYPVRWARYRRIAMDRLMSEIAHSARAVRQDLMISAAVIPDIAQARTQRMQDWPRWLDEGTIDVACPMNYALARQESLFEQRLRDAIDIQRSGEIWMGVGAWRLPPELTISRLQKIWDQGAKGFVLFSHGGVRGQGLFKQLRAATSN